ncbi:short chain dehydrogenase [Methylovirgula sp. 4M-Z18]|uniref:short chain dehydrogenase n=1 Tax=Methylovirgula sp. 4M-Z18 TaxID=2293567 RepID=UPI000E2F9466|nr:short chain dehydrogenase [Methylovirgula sp. 4M-Z18]RFB79006.1 short chain dehydrogenase [Methylovirgula sp. 4M-Z18]
MSQPSLKILLIGASGTLGRAIAAELSHRHEVIPAGKNSGDVRLDLADPASIKAALAKVGKIDAVACAAGKANFTPLSQIDVADIETSAYGLGLRDKLMGQVNLTLAAREHLNPGGSVTLISGILSEHPIAAGSSASMVNGALESFVRAAAVEMPHGQRVNIVSPNVFQESMRSYGPFFRGFDAVPVARAALAFSRSIEGLQTGQVYRVY